MSSRQIPPWLQEKVMKLQQAQQNLQSIIVQRRQIEAEKIDVTKALDELKNASDDNVFFKNVGSIGIKSTRKELVNDLEDRQVLANTRVAVLEKQETRLKESLKTQEAEINNMVKSGNASPPSDASDSRR